MSLPVRRTSTKPYLLLVDGESKTAKTTATAAVRTALEEDGYFVYEADAGVFFRRMTVCVLEALGVVNFAELYTDTFSMLQLHNALDQVIHRDAAFADRHWPNLESVMVELYVSKIGNASAAQHAMETWYDKTVDFATQRSAEVLVINARNPRARLAGWKPLLDLLVYCDPDEAARRILYARGSIDPKPAELAKQSAAVRERRELDRHRKTFPFMDPYQVVNCNVQEDSETAAYAAVAESWATETEPPMTIRFDTTHISLKRTQEGFAALARAALADT